MSSVRERRESVSRDLDAFLARLHDLRPAQWNLPTPDEGWEIRHLASHLVGTIGFLNSCLVKIVQPDLAASHMSGDDVTPESVGEDIIASLTTSRNAIVATLSEFTQVHLTAETGEDSKFMVPSGETYLNISVSEASLHLYDINAALDHGSAGLSDIAVVANNDVFGHAMVMLANMSEAKPDAPVSIHFDGTLFERWMTWTGTEWITSQVADIPVTRIHADDTALVLFACGRIPATDHRLGITGPREPVLQFKTWVPGP